MEMLQRSGRIGVHETARELGVSEMTLRRDLRELEEQKLVMIVKAARSCTPPATSPSRAR